jgi:hypothetical protein
MQHVLTSFFTIFHLSPCFFNNSFNLVSNLAQKTSEGQGKKTKEKKMGQPVPKGTTQPKWRRKRKGKKEREKIFACQTIFRHTRATVTIHIWLSILQAISICTYIYIYIYKNCYYDAYLKALFHRLTVWHPDIQFLFKVIHTERIVILSVCDSKTI